MRGHMASKLENEIRVAELDPKATLIKAGLSDPMIVCDIGAGSGVFTFPAADISSNTVYALEISDEMIEFLARRKEERGTDNLEIRKVVSADLPLENDLCDMVLLVTVLHEIEDKKTLLSEIKRILKPNGKLMIIEFHKNDTPMGPPMGHRISAEYTQELCSEHDLKMIDQFDLGEHYYCLVFEG